MNLAIIGEANEAAKDVARRLGRVPFPEDVPRAPLPDGLSVAARAWIKEQPNGFFNMVTAEAWRLRAAAEEAQGPETSVPSASTFDEDDDELGGALQLDADEDLGAALQLDEDSPPPSQMPLSGPAAPPEELPPPPLPASRRKQTGAPDEQLPRPPRQPLGFTSLRSGTVFDEAPGRGFRDVPVLHRAGDIVVHRSVKPGALDPKLPAAKRFVPGSWTVTHDSTGNLVRVWSDYAIAVLYAEDLNSPEVRPHFDALVTEFNRVLTLPVAARKKHFGKRSRGVRLRGVFDRVIAERHPKLLERLTNMQRTTRGAP